MKNLQFAFAFFLALVASSFTFPSAQMTHSPKNNSLPIAVDYYLKIEGVEGESKDADHKGWIEIQSVSWNTANKTAIIKRRTTSAASPHLNVFCATGQHIVRAVLHQRAASGGYMSYELENVLITSYQTSGAGGSMESFAMNYEKMKR